MTAKSSEYQLGEHSSAIKSLTAALLAMEERHEKAMAATAAAHRAEIREVRDTLDKLSASMTEFTTNFTAIKGGWKTLVILAGIFTALGGAVMKVTTWFLSLTLPR